MLLTQDEAAALLKLIAMLASAVLRPAEEDLAVTNGQVEAMATLEKLARP